MRAFTRLFIELDQTTSTNAKVEAMADYFRQADAGDAAWGVFFLTGRRLKRLVPHRAIREWVIAATGIEGWLLDECYAVVGDGAETAALLCDQLPVTPDAPLPLSVWVEQRLLPLRTQPPDVQRTQVIDWVKGLPRWERLVLFKLLTGELRLGVSQTLVVRALARAAGLPPATIAARLAGDWTPSAAWYRALLSAQDEEDARSRPYPFFLASPLDPGASLDELFPDLRDWMVEWKWDGIRAQLLRRGGQTYLWSRGDELITGRFPEIAAAAAALPDGVVMDGEVLAFLRDRPLPFAALQQRIGRERQVARAARDVPVVFMAFDLLEHDGRDIRDRPLEWRRARLDQLVAGLEPAPAPRAGESLLPFDDASSHSVIRVSPLLAVASREALTTLRERSRAEGVEGLMLKRRTSTYGVGRKRGDWWKWKVDPYTIDAVLIYAQPGSGKRASLLTDYTLGLWHGGELVPVAKAYSGLSNDEIAELDRWIRRHTIERFGPVRHVEPVHVFELGFEAIQRSSRHRSGVAVRFPRMLRWRRDKRPEEADTLETLLGLIEEGRQRKTIEGEA